MINFSTLKGLTIPEGNVTQIADESGMVLWSAVPSVKVAYLRPSANVDVAKWWYTSPTTDNGSIYSLINEAVPDDDSTFIQAAAAGGFTGGDCLFALSGLPVDKITKLLSFNVHMRYFSTHEGTVRNDMTGVYMRHGCKIAGTLYQLTLDGALTVSQWDDYVLQMNGAVSVINQYISDNGTFPEVLLYFCASVTDGEDSKTSHHVKISQAYISFEYE